MNVSILKLLLKDFKKKSFFFLRKDFLLFFWVVVTLEGSTFWKFLTTEMTRSVTSDLSRKEPLTSSAKQRRMELNEREKGLGFRCTVATFTLRYFSKAPLAAAIFSICCRCCCCEWNGVLVLAFVIADKNIDRLLRVKCEAVSGCFETMSLGSGYGFYHLGP